MQANVETMLSEAAGEIGRCAGECGAAIAGIAGVLIRCFEAGGKVLICGNGGSAAEAQHFAAEFINKLYVLRKALPAIPLTTDSSSVTSIGNDMSFEDIFSRQVEALGRPGDVLWGLSTSGRSANVLKAFEAARGCGISRVAFCGMPGSLLEAAADVALTVSCADTGRVQEVHLLAGHIICHLVESHFAKPSP